MIVAVTNMERQSIESWNEKRNNNGDLQYHCHRRIYQMDEEVRKVREQICNVCGN